jgi:hypothetical protein
MPEKKKRRKIFWVPPVILATKKTEIGRISVQGHPGEIVLETPICRITREKHGLEKQLKL